MIFMLNVTFKIQKSEDQIEESYLNIYKVKTNDLFDQFLQGLNVVIFCTFDKLRKKPISQNGFRYLNTKEILKLKFYIKDSTD